MSLSIGFNHGCHFMLDGRQVHVTRVINGNLITVEDVVSLVVFQYTHEQLLSMWSDGRITPMPMLAPAAARATPNPPEVALCHYPQVQVAKALRKKRYIDALLSMPEKLVFTGKKLYPHIRKIAQAIGDATPPGASTVHRWIRRFKRSNNAPISLLDRFETRGWFGCRSSSEVQEALIELIETYYLTPPGIPMKAIHGKLMVRIHELNVLRPADNQLLVPGYDVVRRAIKSYPAYDRAVAKYGKQEASIRFRTSMVAAPAKFILEAAEIDHTPVDLFVIDENTQLPLGRPTLTLLIDRKSRMILGIYVSFGGPSTEAVFQCLRHAILPKDYLKQRYSRVEGNWPCHGLPETLVCDNGLEFHSQALEQACFELGIILQFCPKKKPYFKGRVERAFRSIAHGFFHTQQGTSLANWMDRHGYDPLKTAVATLDEFMHALHIWVVDVYSASYHRELKRPPLGVWHEGVLNNPPRLPDPQTLDIALTEFENRVLWHYGIELFNLRYNSRELSPIRAQLGEKVPVQVRYSRADIGHIYVIHPSTGEAIKVQALAHDYASGLRLEVHQLICKEVREAGQSETNPLQLAQAKERMQAVIGESLGNRKLQKRKRAARLSGANSRDLQVAPMPRAVSAPKPPVRPVQFTVTPKQFKTSFRPWGQGDKP